MSCCLTVPNGKTRNGRAAAFPVFFQKSFRGGIQRFQRLFLSIGRSFQLDRHRDLVYDK